MRPIAFELMRSPRWRPMAVCSIPKRSHSSSVWEKSRAVTLTSCPSARSSSISGRMTSTWGLLVRSTQTRIARVSVVPPCWTPPCVVASVSETLVNETAKFVGEAGLPGIFALMALSSACIPIPSEVVMLFAGFAVADPAQARHQPPHDDAGDHAGGRVGHDRGVVGGLRRRPGRAAGAVRTPRGPLPHGPGPDREGRPLVQPPRRAGGCVRPRDPRGAGVRLAAGRDRAHAGGPLHRLLADRDGVLGDPPGAGRGSRSGATGRRLARASSGSTTCSSP